MRGKLQPFTVDDCGYVTIEIHAPDTTIHLTEVKLNFVGSPDSMRPSARQLEYWGISEKDWDANIPIEDSWFGVRPIQEVYPLKTMDFESQESYNIAVKMVESINA